jgi:thioredoxin 1
MNTPYGCEGCTQVLKKLYMHLFLLLAVVLPQPCLASGASRDREIPDEPAETFHNAVVKIGSTEEFNREILLQSTPALVSFYSDWCPPCRKMAPILNDFARNYIEKVRVYKIDFFFTRELSRQYEIVGIPTLLLFSEGREIGRVTGFRNYAELESFVSAVLH